MSKKAWIKKPKVAIVMSTTANLQVLYEDNHLIAVNKRNSDIVQGDHTGDTNLGEVVRQYIKDKYNKPGKTFTGTIHRLDRPVSGVIIYARTTKGLNRMMNVFKHREIQKTYWAVVRNQPPKMEGTVVNYLIKNEKINKSFAHNHPADGRKESELSYTVLGKTNTYWCVEIKPKTGRHHQIRATMAALGCPIKGDIKYGAKRTNDNASIHLHAREIEFEHPIKKEPIKITAAPPKDPIWDQCLEIATS